jgi:ABC transport system ATP-binding/permease protein
MKGIDPRMPHLILSDASLAYGHVPLLDHADLQLDPGERVALIGRNGCGKSSLLRVLAGQGALDEGALWRQPEIRIGYVPQEPALDCESTVFAAVVSGMGDVSALLAEYHEVSHAMSDPTLEHEPLMERLHLLQDRLESLNAWSFERLAERVIQQFALDAEARVGTLSGGQKKRLALAQALSMSPEMLLLDEPTNHLDIGAIEWLEELLISSGVSMVFVTHDRRFLDRVATRIVELDRGRLMSCPGNFRTYLARKEQILQDEAVNNAKFDKFLAQEEVWIRKGVEARRTRNEGRVLRLEQLRRERAARRERQGKIELALDSGERSGKLVAELEGVSKSFGEGAQTKQVVRDFSCRLQRGDKIGLIGPNGAGKTTLLRLILGELAPDQGKVRLGTKIQVAYFDQFRTQLDEEATLVDVISPGSDYVEIGNEKKHVIGYLGDFLFAPQRARPANVLVLDEPTNDLDIETLELLEQLLQDYAGTLFLVSHDRAFLDNVVTQTIAFEGQGIWHEYAGGYQDWADYQSRRPAKDAAIPPQRSTRVEAGDSARVKEIKPAERRKLSFRESRELAELPARIAALEEEQVRITRQLESPDLYQESAQGARGLAQRHAEIDSELLELLERWESLER